MKLPIFITLLSVAGWGIGLAAPARAAEPATTQSVTSQPSDVPLETSLVDGFSLTDDQVRALEQQLHQNPADIHTRVKLLGFYFMGQYKSPETMAARRGLALWMISNLPAEHITGSPYCWFDPVGDPDGYARAKELWAAQIAKAPKTAPILANAARFYKFTEPQQSLELLERAEAADPTNRDWPDELANLYRQAVKRAKPADRPAFAGRAYAAYEQTLNLSIDPSDKFDALTALPGAAIAAGDLAKAKVYADQLLLMAKDFKNNWNYGNAIYYGYLALGRIALAGGDMENARKYLLAAGRTPGSPQLGSFGPNMILAHDLLEKGDRDTVLKFLSLCARFWNLGQTKIATWTDAINAGQMPDFGVNLDY